ncbi:MAG: elongation factor Ts [Patescibacteria group bacterium]
MAITTQQIQEIREKTGVGIMEAKRALQESDGDMKEALAYLRKRGEKITESKSSRSTAHGVIETYVHSNKKVASVVVLLCETDFVARTEQFQALAHDLAMQVAATKPDYMNIENVPADVIAQKKKEFEEDVDPRKPANIREKIVLGKMEKYYSEYCLLKQPFIKDDAVIIEELLKNAIASLGENIRLKTIGHFSI